MSAISRRALERKLADHLRRDRAHPSRCELQLDGTTVVTPSGTSVGIAMAISQLTGEDVCEVMDRVGVVDAP